MGKSEGSSKLSGCSLLYLLKSKKGWPPPCNGVGQDVAEDDIVAAGPQVLDAAGQESLIPGLPGELALSCLARIPSSSRMKLRGVCRAWRDHCCGEAINHARSMEGFLLDPCYICTCPVMEIKDFAKRSTVKAIPSELWRSKVTCEYLKKKLHTEWRRPVEASSGDVCLDEERILSCLSKLRQHLVSNGKFEPPRDDLEMYKMEMRQHRDMCNTIRSANIHASQSGSWKSRFWPPQVSAWDNDAILFFMIM